MSHPQAVRENFAPGDTVWLRTDAQTPSDLPPSPAGYRVTSTSAAKSDIVLASSVFVPGNGLRMLKCYDTVSPPHPQQLCLVAACGNDLEPFGPFSAHIFTKIS